MDNLGLTCTRQGMFYQPRFPAPAFLGYDPALGRFAAADSLIPGGAQGLDRYAYVNNNPVRYTDPSGHKCQSKDDGCDTPTGDYLPTELDLSKLSKEKGGRTGKSASDLYTYYLSLFYQKEQWWWRAFPKFTIWDFLSLITYNESSYNPEAAGIFAEAGVRFFVEWAETRKKATDAYGVLDWFARFSESAQRLIDTNAVPIPQRRHSPKDVSAMSIVGNSLQNIPASWSAGWAADRPFNWGNSTVLNANAVMMYKNNPQAMFVSLPGDNPFYIPSGCAWLSWQQNQNQAVCP